MTVERGTDVNRLPLIGVDDRGALLNATGRSALPHHDLIFPSARYGCYRLPLVGADDRGAS
jgi:hypothetical protein